MEVFSSACLIKVFLRTDDKAVSSHQVRTEGGVPRSMNVGWFRDSQNKSPSKLRSPVIEISCPAYDDAIRYADTYIPSSLGGKKVSNGIREQVSSEFTPSFAGGRPRLPRVFVCYQYPTKSHVRRVGATYVLVQIIPARTQRWVACGDRACMHGQLLSNTWTMYPASLTIGSVVCGIKMQTLCLCFLRTRRGKTGSQSQQPITGMVGRGLRRDIPLTLSRVLQVGLPVPPWVS